MKLALKHLLTRDPEPVEPNRVWIRDFPLAELGLTLTYIVIAAAWCVVSEDVFAWLLNYPVDSPPLRAARGINFVLLTGLILYLVLRQTFRRTRRAEESLRLSQQRFEAAALATSGAIWELNLDTRVIWWSDSIEKLFGYRAGEVSSKFEWWFDRLHADDRDRMVKTLEKIADSGSHTWINEYRFRRQDGTYAVVLGRGQIIADQAGRPVRIVGGINDISEQRHAEEALENSRKQLQALTARLQSGREEERANVAREIHDELGQMLTALKINIEWLEQKIDRPRDGTSLNPLLDRVVESASIVSAALQTVQRIATDLRPAALDQLGLLAALRDEARRFEQRTGIPCAWRAPHELPLLAPETVTTVFRVFQEALTNVARHSRAANIWIQLDVDANSVALQIEDDGVGIRPEAISHPGSLGLLGMRERATVLGGDLAIMPLQPRGTRVILRLPQALPSGGRPLP